jgi:hypothetical protein
LLDLATRTNVPATLFEVGRHAALALAFALENA